MLKNLILSSLFLLFIGCKESGDDNPVEINGTWVMECFPFQAHFVNIIWNFDNGSYSRTAEAMNECGGEIINEGVDQGVYEFGGIKTMESGLLAQKIDFFPDEPDNLGNINLLDVVYVVEDSLYFGALNENPSCEGEHFILPTWDIMMDDESSFSRFVLSDTCYSRPEELRFDQIFIRE